ncbi:MAG: GNAT family N-acetyltransferase [Chloroflexia bacterium]|nr:GNAT family N-acetyltransferase [Chloroflexia bacterium]
MSKARAELKADSIGICASLATALGGVVNELKLREVVASDLERFFEYQRDPEAARMAAFTAPDPDDRAAFDAHWRRILADPPVPIRTIEQDGAVAGYVLAYESDGVPEVSYWIDRELWGQGIATHALNVFLSQFAHRPLRARAATDNRGSIRVLEKCGFAIVGEERGYANARGEEIAEFLFELVSGQADTTTRLET